MSAPRLAPLLLSALCLSACADRSPEALGRVPGGGATVTGGGSAPASLPAGAGRVVAVRRTPFANGLSQEVVIEGPREMTGENRITVEALTTAGGVGRYGGDRELKIAAPTDRDIAAEMEDRVPGVAMRVAAVAERDALGPFGYAVGTADRLTCVYAWQYVAPARPPSLLEGLSGTGALPMSVRVRLCRDLPAATLVGYLRELRLARPDEGAAAEAARPGLGDDALAAAVGAGAPMAAAEALDPAPRLRRAPRATLRGRVPHAARRRAAAHRGLAHRAVRAPRDGGPEVADQPRLPMPGDVTPASDPRPRAPAAAPRAAALDPDALPMPR